MKTCSLCQVPKSESSFNKNKTKKDGLQTLCKLCSRKKSRKYYENDPGQHIKNVNKRTARIRKENKEKIQEFLKNHPCVDCGEADPIVLEFDHLRDKIIEISVASSRGWPWHKIEKEMDKCEVACANCHRRRTYYRRHKRF